MHLVDGDAKGIIKGRVANWVGQVTVAKITQLVDLIDDPDIKRSGVYVLSGTDPKGLNPEAVYIGESENVWKRLKNHPRLNDDRDEDGELSNYETVAIITSKDDNLTKSGILYLESKLIAEAIDTGRATVNNDTRPQIPSLPLIDQDAMDEFLDYLKLLLPVLGMNFILPSPQISRKEQIQESFEKQRSELIEFHLKTRNAETGVEVMATAQLINGEFVVLEGSTAFLRTEGGYADLKKRLIKKGSLVPTSNGTYQFTKDEPFN
ncbi:MAG: GIY-YIG nuclease family protein, partial [Bacteroidota bacterium]